LPECADAPAFSGAFVDPPEALEPGAVLDLPETLVGRYFQYRISMSGIASGPAGQPQGQSPRLLAVTVTAAVP
jgi:hypothetical protein